MRAYVATVVIVTLGLALAALIMGLNNHLLEVVIAVSAADALIVLGFGVAEIVDAINAPRGRA